MSGELCVTDLLNDPCPRPSYECGPLLAPSPTQTAPAGPTLEAPGPLRTCNQEPGQRLRGGQRVSSEGVEVILPATGTYTVIPFTLAPEGHVVRTCHIESGSHVLIGREDARERSRRVETATAAGLLDQIVASARLVAATIRPPDTGSAGLLATHK